MAKPRLDLAVGEHYGALTVLSINAREKTGKHYTVHVRCDCGNEFDTLPSAVKRNKFGCVKCRSGKRSQEEAQRHVGEQYGVWLIERSMPHCESGRQLYECRCIKCGNTSLKTLGNIKSNRDSHCKNCKPNYDFWVTGKAAIGTLPDGTEFLVDASDIEKVSGRWWHFNKTLGYIFSFNGKGAGLPLHRFLLGIDGSTIVDHINRNPLDNRRENLRVVTERQNSWNHSKPVINTTGFIGVVFLKKENKYWARIGQNGRMIPLCKTTDPVIAAQAYDIAAKYLRGEYVGELNGGLEPETWLVEKVIARCMPYLEEVKEFRKPINFAEKTEVA